MNEDFDPRPMSDAAKGKSDEGLAHALERLLHGRGADAESEARARDLSAGQEPDPDLNPDPGVSPVAAGGHCPQPGDWTLLLDEHSHGEDLHKVNLLLAHAAGCSECAQRLRSLSAEITAEETAALAGVASASLEGQRKLAKRLAATSVSHTTKRKPHPYLWLGAGVAASLLIALGLSTWRRIVNNPERLLAQSYTQSRIFDLRMPGAGYAEVTPQVHLRGASVSRVPAKLRAAQARVEDRLAVAPQDAHMLELEARADVLEERFDAAIGILDRLVAQGPVTAALLLDDASAYFQRGLATGSESDRAAALEDLRHADELAPGDPVVLFNEAIAMEDRGELINAVETWNRYLRFERDPQWQAEGRRRLQALEQRLNQLKAQPGR